MRIGIDGRLSGSRHAGIGRYVENLLQRLPLVAPEIEWTFFYAEKNQLQFAERFKNVKLVYAPIKHYTLAEQWQLAPIFDQADLDLLHVPHFNAPLAGNCPLVITIHDLLWHEFKGAQVTTLPTWLYWPKYLGYRLISSQAVKRAAAILVPAETVKKTVIKYYPKSESKIKVTKEGVTASFFQKENSTSKPEPLLVYLGSLYPHKNVAVVIRALKELPRYQLVIVGARNVFQEQIREVVRQNKVESQVEFAGYLEDVAVAKLLSQATALVQPSLSEGFGLTGVEAMAAGVPVIASDIPIFREIYHSAALFFDPTSPTAFATQVRAAAQSSVRQSMIKAGTQTVKEYDWGTMVNETLAVYRQVLTAHA